jgi:hypothetical protein
MRVYLYFLEMSQNSLSLLHWIFLLILHRIELAEFCGIIISLNKKNSDQPRILAAQLTSKARSFQTAYHIEVC